jgi:hypothetical protein
LGTLTSRKEHFVHYSGCEVVKVFRFLISRYSLIGSITSRTTPFVTVKEDSVQYCRCEVVVKLFRFMMSRYSLTGTYNILQNCTFRDSTGALYTIGESEEVMLFRFLLSPLCDLAVRVPGYRSRGPDSIPCATTFSEYRVWNGAHSAS